MVLLADAAQIEVVLLNPRTIREKVTRKNMSMQPLHSRSDLCASVKNENEVWSPNAGRNSTGIPQKGGSQNPLNVQAHFVIRPAKTQSGM